MHRVGACPSVAFAAAVEARYRHDVATITPCRAEYLRPWPVTSAASYTGITLCVTPRLTLTARAAPVPPGRSAVPAPPQVTVAAPPVPPVASLPAAAPGLVLAHHTVVTRAVVAASEPVQARRHVRTERPVAPVPAVVTASTAARAPATAQRPPQAPPAVPGIALPAPAPAALVGAEPFAEPDLRRLTDQVIRRIDDRLLARRERHGRA